MKGPASDLLHLPTGVVMIGVRAATAPAHSAPCPPPSRLQRRRSPEQLKTKDQLSKLQGSFLLFYAALRAHEPWKAIHLNQIELKHQPFSHSFVVCYGLRAQGSGLRAQGSGLSM